MFRQVFSKLFNNNSNQRNQLTPCEQYNGQAQIYAIPTISSGFDNRRVTSSSTGGDLKNGQMSFRSESSTISASSTSSFGSTNLSKLDYYAKYDDNNTKQIYIAPHCIRYSNSTLDDTIYRIDDESLNEIAAEVLESESLPPKLQIVFYDGVYFAINNSNLQIYKQLQLSGLITHVQADLISVEAIPFALREFLLQTPSSLNNYNHEFTDEEYHEVQNSDMSSETNRSSNVTNESLNDSENNEMPDEHEVIFGEDVFDENDIYVDEIYEFGVCENCLESGDEEGQNSGEKIQESQPLEDLKLKGKIDVYLKKKDSTFNETNVDLNEVVKKVLENEEAEKCVFRNLDNQTDLTNELKTLRLDVDQKKMNDDLFLPRLFTSEENKKFIAKNVSKMQAAKKVVENVSESSEVESLLITYEDDEA